MCGGSQRITFGYDRPSQFQVQLKDEVADRYGKYRQSLSDEGFRSRRLYKDLHHENKIGARAEFAMMVLIDLPLFDCYGRNGWTSREGHVDFMLPMDPDFVGRPEQGFSIDVKASNGQPKNLLLKSMDATWTAKVLVCCGVDSNVVTFYGWEYASVVRSTQTRLFRTLRCHALPIKALRPMQALIDTIDHIQMTNRL